VLCEHVSVVVIRDCWYSSFTARSLFLNRCLCQLLLGDLTQAEEDATCVLRILESASSAILAHSLLKDRDVALTKAYMRRGTARSWSMRFSEGETVSVYVCV